MSLRGRRAGIRSPVSMDRYLVATVGTMQVSFSAEAVEGLLTIEECDAIGPLTVQGQVYAVVDVANRLGLSPAADGPEARVILLAQGNARASIRVASVHGLVECERRHVLPLPHQFRGEERGWYAGLMLLDEGVAVVLRTQWLLTEADTGLPSESEGQEHRLLSNTGSPVAGRGLSC